MSERDDLIDLIDGATWSLIDSDVVADAILAAGWRKTDEVGHNHWNPTVMPYGECPACDQIHDEVDGR